MPPLHNPIRIKLSNARRVTCRDRGRTQVPTIDQYCGVIMTSDDVDINDDLVLWCPWSLSLSLPQYTVDIVNDLGQELRRRSTLY